MGFRRNYEGAFNTTVRRYIDTMPIISGVCRFAFQHITDINKLIIVHVFNHLKKKHARFEIDPHLVHRQELICMKIESLRGGRFDMYSWAYVG